MLSRFLLTLTLTLGPAAMAAAHDYNLGDLNIDHPMSFETAETARTGAGYLTIENTGDSADRLIEVRADIPRIEIHTIEEDDGVVRMVQMEQGVEIPAGETVMLEPGGLHVMFMGLEGPLVAGAEFPATLVFEKAGELEVVFKIEERNGAAAHDHSNHGD